MELEPGPEIEGTATTQAGRWRLHVPKVCIEEVREMEFGKAFPKIMRKIKAKCPGC
jgi:hypothetical protein